MKKETLDLLRQKLESCCFNCDGFDYEKFKVIKKLTELKINIKI